MKDIVKLIKIAIFIAFAWCIMCAVKPYWNKYWLGQAIKNAAIKEQQNPKYESEFGEI